MVHIQTVGSKAQVYHGTAKHTPGGLTKKDLMKTKDGRVVSHKQHQAGKKAIKRLFSLGFKPQKGVFKLFSAKKTKKGRKHKTRKTRKSKKRCGGDASGNSLASMFSKLVGGKEDYADVVSDASGNEQQV